MTRFTLISIIYFFLTSCNQSKKDDCNFIKTQFYSTGKIQYIFSLKSDTIKNGECFYFNEYGFLDSSMTFSNGILQGLKRIYYDNETDTYNYNNGRLISHCVYDSLNNLVYKTPLDINKVGKTQIIFFSKRNYFGQDMKDTFTITNEGLPPYNRRLSVTGAIIEHLYDTTFSIRTSKHFADLKKVIIKVSARQNISDTTENAVLIDSIVIPIR